MAVTYADNTKKVIELYSKEKDQWGRVVERKLGFQKVFYCDAESGSLALGPFIEPVSDVLRSVDNSFPALSQDVIGREYVDDRHDGGQFGFWKHPCV